MYTTSSTVFSSYNRYHSSFKKAIKLGIVPKKQLSSVPSSTLHNFRSSSFKNLVGSEFDWIDHKLLQVKEIIDSKTATSVAHAVLRIAHFFKNFGKPIDKLSKIKVPEIKEKVVRLIKRVSKVLPLKTVLKVFLLSKHKFSSWAKNPVGCLRSPFYQCLSSSPHQLTTHEVKEIAKAYLDPVKASWTSFSIAATLLRDRIVVASTGTIQKYAIALGISKRKVRKKIHKRGSIFTTAINQWWHIDVTRFFSKDNVEFFLNLIMDNFSRKVVSWTLSRNLSANTVRLTIAKALSHVPDKSSHTIKLLSDGGPENVNLTVEEYLESTPISHLVAQKDIACSNSMIEALNKTLKYRHIFPHPMPKADGMHSCIECSINEYENRPHSVLKGLTPKEVYDGKVFNTELHKRILQEAKVKRMKINKASCPPCAPIVTSLEETGEIGSIVKEHWSSSDHTDLPEAEVKEVQP